jgi:hypothetical protein
VIIIVSSAISDSTSGLHSNQVSPRTPSLIFLSHDGLIHFKFSKTSLLDSQQLHCAEPKSLRVLHDYPHTLNYSRGSPVSLELFIHSFVQYNAENLPMETVLVAGTGKKREQYYSSVSKCSSKSISIHLLSFMTLTVFHISYDKTLRQDCTR